MSDPHELQVRVRYGETDQMGNVYHANYLAYFDLGRTSYIRENGQSYRDLEAAGVLLAVVDLGIKYHAPAYYEDVLTVRTTLTEVRKTRVRFDYEVTLDDRLIVTGHTVLACLDADRKPRRIPENLLAALR